jgi:hypothetical protein
VLEDVYAALDLDWDPATAGAADDDVPGLTVGAVEHAVLEAYAAHEGEPLREGELEAATVTRARELADGHRLS